MQNRELFRWAFAGSGLWLMLSPFLLLGGQSALSNAVIGDAGTLVIMGLLALILSGFSFSKHALARAYSGLALGLVLVAAPWVVEFTDSIATWNAGLVGTLLALVALYEGYQHRSGHHA